MKKGSSFLFLVLIVIVGCGSINLFDKPEEGLPDGLILWNKLGSASEVSNSIVGVNGVLSDGISYNSGVFGNATLFTNNAYISFNVLSPSNKKWGVDEIAIEFWAKPKVLAQNDNYIFDFVKGMEHADGYLRLIHLNSTSYRLPPSFVGESGGSNLFSWDTNQYHHFAMSISKNMAYVFIDGVLDIVKSLSSDITNTYMPYQIVLATSWHYAGIYSWDGNIDNLKIWNYAKTNFDDRFVE
jgi:hypothetical protein